MAYPKWWHEDIPSLLEKRTPPLFPRAYLEFDALKRELEKMGKEMIKKDFWDLTIAEQLLLENIFTLLKKVYIGLQSDYFLLSGNSDFQEFMNTHLEFFQKLAPRFFWPSDFIVPDSLAGFTQYLKTLTVPPLSANQQEKMLHLMLIVNELEIMPIWNKKDITQKAFIIEIIQILSSIVIEKPEFLPLKTNEEFIFLLGAYKEILIQEIDKRLRWENKAEIETLWKVKTYLQSTSPK